MNFSTANETPPFPVSLLSSLSPHGLVRLGVNLARLALLMVVPAALRVVPVPVVVPVVSAAASRVVPLLVVGVVPGSVHHKLADGAIRGSPLNLAALLPGDGALLDGFRLRVIGMGVIGNGAL